MKIIKHSWGAETIIGRNDRVVRLYQSSKGVTVDLSQVRDREWAVFKKIVAKYGDINKIKLPVDTDIKPIIKWLNS